MAQNRNKKIRDLRKRGKDRLVRVNDQLNALTWDLSERNVAHGDVNTNDAIAILDRGLDLIQQATALLNSVVVTDEAPAVEAPKSAAPASKARTAEPKVVAPKAPPVATLKS